jgi:hypothetical protein
MSRQPEAQPCQDNPSRWRLGRLCLTKNHTTLIIIIINLLFLSGIIALSYLRLSFRLTKTNRHSQPLNPSYRIPNPRATPITSSNGNLCVQKSRGGAAPLTPIFAYS